MKNVIESGENAADMSTPGIKWSTSIDFECVNQSAD